jgi:NMD protein affecting ribosome stability and mRNA decay
MTTTRTSEIAQQIFEQMNTEDRAGYLSQAWEEGVSNMLVDEWAGANLADILDALKALCDTWMFAEDGCPADPDGCTAETCTRNDCAGCGAASNPKDRVCYRCGAALEGAPVLRRVS